MEAPRGRHEQFLPFLGIPLPSGTTSYASCAKCALQQIPPPCEHSSADRSFHTFLTAPEIKKGTLTKMTRAIQFDYFLVAMTLGYDAIKIHQIWHVDKMASGFYDNYMNAFLRLKVCFRFQLKKQQQQQTHVNIIVRISIYLFRSVPVVCRNRTRGRKRNSARSTGRRRVYESNRMSWYTIHVYGLSPN